MGAVVLASAGWLNLALPALNFLYYCAIGGGMLLAWRFHSSRIFLSLAVIVLAQQGIALTGGQSSYLLLTAQAIAVLVPMNFVLIAVIHERGFTMESVAPVALLLFVESLTVAVFCGAAGGKASAHVRLVTSTLALPRYALTVLAAACVFLLVRFLFTRRPVDSALLWSLGAAFLALRSTPVARTATLYWVTAACVLGASIIESSYLLAYHDELTALPSRRAFNDALLRLREPYSIAVVDIDHFKKFNDTYGHETGDQVLRLVAGKLARVTGGGEAYRCGGEEFNILFPGKNIPDVAEHLEKLRQTIASAEFRVRAGERRQMPRGPERRVGRNIRRASKGQAIRQLAEASAEEEALSVTVSIGVASATKDGPHPQNVLQAADKALYRAKANGRNRLETTAAARRPRVKTAGIA